MLYIYICSAVFLCLTLIILVKEETFRVRNSYNTTVCRGCKGDWSSFQSAITTSSVETSFEYCITPCARIEDGGKYCSSVCFCITLLLYIKTTTERFSIPRTNYLIYQFFVSCNVVPEGTSDTQRVVQD